MTPDEFIDFYSYWRPHMVRYMAWRLRRKQDAEDATQDLFEDLSRRSGHIELATAKRYLWVAARHRAINTRVFNYRLPMTFDPQAASNVQEGVDSTPESRLTNLVQRHTSQITASDDQAIVDRDAMHETLSVLPPRERGIIAAVVLGGITVAAYAQAAGVGEQRIRALRDRGIDRLRLARHVRA